MKDFGLNLRISREIIISGELLNPVVVELALFFNF